MSQTITAPGSSLPPAPATHVTRFVLLAGVTLLLLVICTEVEIALREVVGVHRPYTILYLIPVAIGAALLGIRGGIATALLSVVLARLYLFNNDQHGASLLFSFPNVADTIEFCALLVGTLTVATVTGRLRTTMGALRDSSELLESANVRLRETEEERRVFHRDVLMAVTGGKLRLVEPEEMPPPDLVSGPPQKTMTLTSPQDATFLRQTLKPMAEALGMSRVQIDDLSTGVTEAATNAIKHGNGGWAKIWTRPDSIVVQIQDQGEGIAPALIARATLEQGYSSRTSLGMGFFLMLQSADTLVLSTSGDGTSVLLRVGVKSNTSDQERLLARYIGI